MFNGKSGKKRFIGALLSLVLVLAMISQFALPAMADTCTAYTYSPGNYGAGDWLEALSAVVIGHNTTQGIEVDLPYTGVDSGSGSGTFTLTYYVPNDGCMWGIQMTWEATTGTGDTLYTESGSYNTTVTTTGSFTGDSPTTATNEATSAYNEATSAYNEAVTAASNASTAASNASTAATNASTAATNASNAYTAANTASTNTTNDPTADTAITNSTTGVAATNATVGTINTNTAATNTTVGTINTDTAQYNGGTAAYWANQAATAAASNIIPVISSVVGQNGATCTTGTTFTANVAVSPSSSITYTVTGVPGYSATGNSITFTGLSTPGAYTATITATYTPTGKSCSYPFTFFYI